MRKTLSIIIALLVLVSCKNKTSEENTTDISDRQSVINTITHAQGFRLYEYSDYSILEVDDPWPDADKTFRYLLYTARSMPLQDAEDNFDAILTVPVKGLVVTSTTHIPSLETLGGETKLVGFPQTDYISSPKTRALIDSGTVKELGGT
ncbi:MAG: ABC transporter substrate-binding protein, partial [Gilvibacter sp.]|nr:ABC transporter substrate-binding protein [Gilvibacter sp.]